MNKEVAVVALGSSLGGRFRSPEAVVTAAIHRLAGEGFVLLKHSSLWSSASWPDPTLPAYINAVAVVETPSPPRETLARLHAIEAEFGRGRSSPNAPRVLDLDLICQGQRMIDEPGLVLPHPRAAERLFVMGPLAQVAPDWCHPVLGETAEALAAKASVGRDARPL